MEILKQKIHDVVKLFQSGEIIKTEKETRELIKENPKISFLYNLLGLSLNAQNRSEEAMKVYNLGLKIDPKNAMIYNNLALIYYNKSQKSTKFKTNIKKAEELYKKCLELNPKIPEANTNLGNLYNSIDKNDEAIKYHKLAISADPKYFFSFLNLAHVYISIGNFTEGKNYLKQAIEQNPNFILAHRELSRITKYSKNNTHLKKLQELYENTDIKDSDNKMNLSFALGKAYEDIENFDESFKFYETGNLINRTKINFSIEEENNYFNEIKKTYNQKLFNKYKNFGEENRSPIFIVGMPRSGTTLVEQILSSHSKVYGAEEIFLIPELIDKYFSRDKLNFFLQGIFNFDESNFKKMGEEYISLTKDISNNSERTTDKFPANFLYIGLIKLILPKSKIIHCQRNPKDNIFSIYKNYFPGNRITFGCDLNEAVQYYNMYFDLMKFWNNILPNFILNLKYEDLVNNTDDQVKKLLNFCDLNWEDKCLKFYDTKRPIRTASDTQVRNKIYKTSIDLWKNYEKFLNKYYIKLRV